MKKSYELAITLSNMRGKVWCNADTIHKAISVADGCTTCQARIIAKKLKAVLVIAKYDNTQYINNNQQYEPVLEVVRGKLSLVLNITDELTTKIIDRVKVAPIARNPTAVYLARSSTMLYKIGISANDIDVRMRQIEHACGGSMSVLYTTNVPNARMVEKQLHVLFARYRTYGEWFDIPYDPTEEIIAYIQKIQQV